MITRSQLIFYCYFYIVGLVAAMVVPVDPAHLNGINAASVAALVALGVGLLHLHRVGARNDALALARAVRLVWMLLAVSSLTLGYARHLSANTVADMRLGDLFEVEGVSE